MGRLVNQQWETVYEGMLCVSRAETLEDSANESIGCIAALVLSKRYLLFTFTRYLPGDIQFGDVFAFGRPAARFGQILAAQKEQEKPSGMSRFDAMERYGLTVRELQVAQAIAQGCTDDEVAERLSVSSATVRKHLYNAYAKLAVNKRSQLKELFGV